MRIDIPGYETIEVQYLLLDYNGTIAVDGVIPEEIKEKLRAISQYLTIFVLTADTHGTARKMCEDLPVGIHTFPEGNASPEKLRFLRELGADHCVAIGNGRNDIAMCEQAALSVAVIGEEGVCSALLAVTDISVTKIAYALELLQKPKRIIATLRG